MKPLDEPVQFKMAAAVVLGRPHSLRVSASSGRNPLFPPRPHAESQEGLTKLGVHCRRLRGTCATLGLAACLLPARAELILSVDYTQGTVSVWDSQSFQSISTFASGLFQPLGVGVDKADYIYVTTYDETTGSILKYNKHGAVVDSITGLTFRPYAITQGPDGFLYSADAAGQRIVRINTDLDSGSLSTWATMVGQPTALQFDSSGNLFVTTAVNGNNVQKFSPDGTLLGVLANDGSLGGFPSGIALDSNGDFYVGRSFTGANVARFNSSGTLINADFASVPSPYGLLKGTNFLFVASGNGSIYRFSLADGSAQGTITPGTLGTYMAFAPVGIPESSTAPVVALLGTLSVLALRRLRTLRL